MAYFNIAAMSVGAINIFGNQWSGFCKYDLICHFDFFRNGFCHRIADAIECLIKIIGHSTDCLEKIKKQRENES